MTTCAGAAALFSRSAALGNLRACAESVWIVIHGRKRVVLQQPFRHFQVIAARESVCKASSLGCMHSSGVLSYCLVFGIGCRTARCRALPLARASCAAGSRFGQFVMGHMHRFGYGGLERSNALALHYFRLAASQSLDAAQCSLGDMYALSRFTTAFAIVFHNCICY